MVPQVWNGSHLRDVPGAPKKTPGLMSRLKPFVQVSLCGIMKLARCCISFIAGTDVLTTAARQQEATPCNNHQPGRPSRNRFQKEDVSWVVLWVLLGPSVIDSRVEILE